MKGFKSILIFIFIAYFVSWVIFISLALNHHQILFLFPDDAAHARVQDLWHSAGALGPVVAALITLRAFYGKEGLLQFKQGYSLTKLNAKGWILTFSPLLLFGFALLVNRIIEGDWVSISAFFQNNEFGKPVHWLFWFLPILTYGFGEEAGWRGFALPALQTRYPAFRATIILSLIWACWHIPSFFYRYDLKGVAYVGFLLGIFAGAIWLTFLFNYTKGSILAVSLWHFTFNAVSMIGKDEQVLSAVMSTMVMLLAVFVMLKYKLEHLSPIKRTMLNKKA